MKETIIYALGYFDGVHLGHQALLSACRELAAENGSQSGAVTFLGHPEQLLKGCAPAQINTPEDRKVLLLQKVDTVKELPFDKALMDTPWEHFLDELVEKHSADGFVCGSDFRFGQKGQGTAELLQRYCQSRDLPCRIVPQQTLDGIRVSSTHIRTLLEQGKMEEAARFLGRPHILSGTVSRGQQLGRTIGFPTANLTYPRELVKLPYGVYACRVTVQGQSCMAVANVGTRPTVEGKGVTVESHLLGFSGDLYGKTIQLQFLAFVRPERKFPTVQALQGQIQADCEAVKKMDY